MPGGMTGRLEELKRGSLKIRRKDRRLIMLYKGVKGAANILSNFNGSNTFWTMKNSSGQG